MRLCQLTVPLLLVAAASCDRSSSEPSPLSSARPVAAEAKHAFLRPRAAEPDGAGPLRIETLDPHLYPPVFVTRGGERGPAKLVFLHGLCSHGLGYAQSFQYAAAKKGTLIAPQGDVVCGKGPRASWSSNVERLNARVVETFRELGEREPIADIAVIGYSQGASRALALARAFPERYSRLILIGGPERPSPEGLTHLKAVVTMAGERDRQDLMQAGALAFKHAKVPAKFFVIPKAMHGQMGPSPEETMGQSLDFLFEQSR